MSQQDPTGRLLDSGEFGRTLLLHGFVLTYLRPHHNMTGYVFTSGQSGNAEMFAYQCRAFLDEVSGMGDPLPACASFADALHTMKVLRSVVRSADDEGTTVAVG